MGLDSYLYRETPRDTKFKLPHPLVGGMFSNHGEDGSFRGKVYSHLIEEVTDGEYSLYVEEMSPEKVKDLAQKLERWYEKNKETIKKQGGFLGCTPEEIESLVELFKQAAEKGCRYMGWW